VSFFALDNNILISLGKKNSFFALKAAIKKPFWVKVKYVTLQREGGRASVTK